MPSTIKQCKTMQNSCHAMRKIVQNEILLQAVHTCTPCSNSIFSAQNRVKSSRPYVHVSGRMRQPKKNWARKKRMASWARQRQQITEAADGGARARTGADGAVVLNLRRGRAALGRQLRALPPGPAASQQGLRLQPAPHPRGAQRLLRNGQKKLVRSLQGGEHRLTKLGKGFFRDKYYEYLVHVPVIIRGRRRNAGAGYERRDWLPVNELGGATRHPAHLTEEQVAQRVRQQVEASLDPGGPILQLSDETYFLDLEGHWVVSTQSTRYRNSRTEVETLLRQRMRGLRSVSFQLPCEEDVLPSAFEDKPLCVPRQLAELLQLSVEEVCADFDAMLRHDWRRLGISAEEVREFCVWRNAPMRVLSSQGDLVDSYDPALKEHRTVCFLAFDGHCYMYRAVKRVLERQAARVLYRGEARQALPPIQEWRRFDAADVQPGCSGARTCARRGGSSWPSARAPRWPSAARRSTAG